VHSRTRAVTLANGRERDPGTKPQARPKRSHRAADAWMALHATELLLLAPALACLLLRLLLLGSHGFFLFLRTVRIRRARQDWRADLHAGGGDLRVLYGCAPSTARCHAQGTTALWTQLQLAHGSSILGNNARRARTCPLATTCTAPITLRVIAAQVRAPAPSSESSDCIARPLAGCRCPPRASRRTAHGRGRCYLPRLRLLLPLPLLWPLRFVLVASFA